MDAPDFCSPQVYASSVYALSSDLLTASICAQFLGAVLRLLPIAGVSDLDTIDLHIEQNKDIGIDIEID